MNADELKSFSQESATRVFSAPKRKRKEVLEEQLDKLSPVERDTAAAWIAAYKMTQDQKPKIHPERKALFACAVGFFLLLWGTAIGLPHPSPEQHKVFRIILALMAGAFGAFIPGALNVKFNFGVVSGKAVSAVGFFIVVYAVDPA